MGDPSAHFGFTDLKISGRSALFTLLGLAWEVTKTSAVRAIGTMVRPDERLHRDSAPGLKAKSIAPSATALYGAFAAEPGIDLDLDAGGAAKSAASRSAIAIAPPVPAMLPCLRGRCRSRQQRASRETAANAKFRV